MDAVLHRVVLNLIGDFVGISVALSVWMFFTALSIFEVESFEVKVSGISGLSGEVTIKTKLLSEVYTLSRLPWVESDVGVITSTVGDFVSSFSSMRMNDLFWFFNWSLVYCRTAALDFDRNVSLGFLLWLPCLGWELVFCSLFIGVYFNLLLDSPLLWLLSLIFRGYCEQFSVAV